MTSEQVALRRATLAGALLTAASALAAWYGVFQDRGAGGMVAQLWPPGAVLARNEAEFLRRSHAVAAVAAAYAMPPTMLVVTLRSGWRLARSRGRAGA